MELDKTLKFLGLLYSVKLISKATYQIVRGYFVEIIEADFSLGVTVYRTIETLIKDKDIGVQVFLAIRG